MHVLTAGVRGTGLLRRNVKRFRGELVFKAHEILYRSTLGLRVIKKKKKMFEGRDLDETGVVAHDLTDRHAQA